MPTYQTQITAQPSNSQTNPATARLRVEEQFIKEAVRFAAPGSNNTVKAAIRFGDQRLLPEPGQDATVFPGQAGIEPIQKRIPGVPNTLTVRAWTVNASFAHTVTVRVVTKALSDIPQPVNVVSLGQPQQPTQPLPAPEDIQSAGDDG